MIIHSNYNLPKQKRSESERGVGKSAKLISLSHIPSVVLKNSIGVIGKWSVSQKLMIFPYCAVKGDGKCLLH